MLKLKRIAITGGISSGKSTVCAAFADLNAYVISLDQIVHHLLGNNIELQKQIVALLGKEVIAQGTINRKKVAEIVFRSTEKLYALEALIHPLVRQEVKKEWLKAQSSSCSLFVVEAPLLFETEDPTQYDATVCVVTDPHIAQARSQLSKDEFLVREARLLPLHEKVKKATYVLNNNGSKEDLIKETRALFNTLSASQGDKVKL